MSFLFEYSWVLSRGECFYNNYSFSVCESIVLFFFFSIATDQKHSLTFIVCIPCHYSGVEVDSKCEGTLPGGGAGRGGCTPQDIGNLDFLGGKRNLGKASF